ncbi:FtsK/SpoIIIE domain-containing protein [Lysinibacillus fusiformis]|uniref:FtsK/SpoIIIE domain-containing protein n=1 Tax=Lysinibacillus fusiformis TaxID=28031 RepID=UPI00263A7BF8|nr:FtsK/SpoIIIE domain-containing protein [Lysinibacillus fusiformis]MDC6267704.1 FtsK/SpoIIIE domain-containing protein [Lysinibacillus sphaericus]MDN4967807.1 FtsK/SpoIIIE domain-containing protein [Lysinibacillus fusiformis]MDN4967863.1 FtsK/SpoIIIE domain-containing protein [Lysinibacillus fusiformis]
MLFELVTSSVFGGIAFHAFMKKKNLSTNESGKIQRIMSLSGLNVKDGKDTLTTQLVKKKKYEWGWEYKYRIPLGRSFNDYLSKINVLEDGLNNRRKQINFNDVLTMDWKGDLIKNLHQLWKSKLTEQKEIELDFDGFLIIRVYDKPLPKRVDFHAGESWEVPVGVAREKNSFRYHDFEKVPHVVLGGATRYGKSNLINSIICSLLHSNSDNVHFFLVDLKGGVELCDYEKIKQTVSIAYEPEEALQTLQQAYNQMREIQTLLRKKGKKNVQEAGIKERYFVIVDEVGELNPLEAVTREEKVLKQQCQSIMSQIARIGAGLGFRQILATQYPTGDVIPRQCKQNSDAKISFRVQSAIASRVVLDEQGAESLPMIKGRAIYQTADKREILQTPLITSDEIQSIILPHLIKEGEFNEKETSINKTREDIVTFTEV